MENLYYSASFFIFGIIILCLYIGKIPVDISHGYTDIDKTESSEKNKKLYKLLFRFWYPLFIIPIVSIPEGDELILFKSGLGLVMLLSIVPEYWPKVTGRLHVFYAAGGILLMIVAIIFEFNFGIWNLLLLLFVVPAFALELKLVRIPNKTFWVEVGAGLTGIICLWFYLRGEV